MHPQRPAALTQAELLRLENFLRSDASGADAMSLSRAHGFITAVVSGPESFETAEWIRLIFDEPVFQEADQAQDILGLILRLHADIVRTLPLAGEFSLIFEFTRNASGLETFHSGEWCKGYLSAMALWAAPLTAQMRQTLEPLFLLAGPRNRAEQELRAARYADLCAMLPSMAEAVYWQWHPPE